MTGRRGAVVTSTPPGSGLCCSIPQGRCGQPVFGDWVLYLRLRPPPGVVRVLRPERGGQRPSCLHGAQFHPTASPCPPAPGSLALGLSWGLGCGPVGASPHLRTLQSLLWGMPLASASGSW
ncbi:hypothetical protein H8959_019834 [Pygathrix nigripes]